MLRWVVSFGSFEFSFQSIRERCDNQLAIIFFGWVVQPPIPVYLVYHCYMLLLGKLDQ